MLRRLMSIPRLARNSVIAFMDRHAAVTIKPALSEPLCIETITWHRRHVTLKGHAENTEADVGFQNRASLVTVQNQIDLTLPRPDRKAGLVLKVSGTNDTCEFSAPHRARTIAASISTLPKLITTLWAARRQLIRFFITNEVANAAQLRRLFALTPEEDAAVAIPANLFDASPPPEVPPVTIIIPIYNAADDTERLLKRLPNTLTGNPGIIAVDDGSSDPRIEKLLDAATGLTVLRHTSNLGFIAAVTSGIAASTPGDHIVILNTDTIPPRGWLPRLLAPIVRDPTGVASVTPFSNAAEVLSIPTAELQTALTAQHVDTIDAQAKHLTDRQIDLPTGIGFCMAMNRRFLDKVGGFDPAFGRGYGEEVDWCQRAKNAGGRHLVAPLFVGHLGGASFGPDKQMRIRQASRIISHRYPSYDADVQNWIRTAPAGPEKLALTLAWMASTHSEVSIFLGHSFGGGAEHALQTQVASLEGVVILRVGGPRPWRIELQTPHFHMAGDVPNAEMVHALLAPLKVRRVIYSCGVGAANPTDVPRMLLDLCQGKFPLEVQLHDFFPISPSWNLLNDDDIFQGVPNISTQDPAHQPPGDTHENWRKLWGQVFEHAETVHAFAPSGADLIRKAYPQADGKVMIAPHALPEQMPKPFAPGDAIGVLGRDQRRERRRRAAIAVEAHSKTHRGYRRNGRPIPPTRPACGPRPL